MKLKKRVIKPKSGSRKFLVIQHFIESLKVTDLESSKLVTVIKSKGFLSMIKAFLPHLLSKSIKQNSKKFILPEISVYMTSTAFKKRKCY